MGNGSQSQRIIALTDVGAAQDIAARARAHTPVSAVVGPRRVIRSEPGFAILPTLFPNAQQNGGRLNPSCRNRGQQIEEIQQRTAASLFSSSHDMDLSDQSRPADRLPGMSIGMP